ncbi:proline iminopeptidase [Legionella busanensis]|uniref:Proline iminopeptidase n=1 Tax=Legionella busanensis TaxID=190655 RepID=A0A378JP20_9GAMM|nr:alpha/beta fold hydrolase [Legionella busanensis]STX52033.1 proline iminopeptidase [Legionella busanensis]
MPQLDQYPIAALHSSGFIEVTKDTFIYYEQRGNPNGPAVVYNHGGPGGASAPKCSQWFDPKHYNIILYDQRGTGQSKPSVATETAHPKQFGHLTIDDMAQDLDILRQALNINQWLVFGGSWGSTLSLYYAAKYPQHVTGLIIYGIFLNTIEEMDVYYNEKLFIERFPELGPEAFDILVTFARLKGLGIDNNSSQSFVEAYYQLCVNENDSAAQYLWTAFEDFNDNPSKETLENLRNIPQKIEPIERTLAVFESTLFKQAYNGLNLLSEALLINLKNIDVRIVQGTDDTEAPPIFAQKLVDALLKVKPDLWYRFVDGKHDPNSSDKLVQTLINCTDDFKNKPNALTIESSLNSATHLVKKSIFAQREQEKKSKIIEDENQLIYG